MSLRGPGKKLPYIEKIAQCYEALDLPYGADMEQVDKRWKQYLEKCHPDRHAHNPNLLSDAYKLTGILTYAHGEIIEAWQRFGINTPYDLPYSEEIAHCYEALDLPYGASMERVNRRWREYLLKCHPDRHAQNPDILPDATKLTQILTQAYEKIKEAWVKYQASE
jgi:curved DNA-binding protein CbpA